VESADRTLPTVVTLNRLSELTAFSKSNSCMSVSVALAGPSSSAGMMKGVIPKLVIWSDLRGAEKEGSDVLGIRLYVVANKMTLKNPRWSMLSCKIKPAYGASNAHR
jgi:hypothetical protein